ncbi:MAG: hypothetical protein ACQEQM_04620 [Thermoplasmatota archaeon]
MEKTIILILVILLVGVAFVGCNTETPRPPAYDMPKIVLDYSVQMERPNETIIFIHGVEDVMYDRLVLELDNETVMNNTNAFSIEYKTNRTTFFLNADAYREEDMYNFNATIETYHNYEVINRFTITHLDGSEENIKPQNLPFIRRMNKMEEDS